MRFVTGETPVDPGPTANDGTRERCAHACGGITCFGCEASPMVGEGRCGSRFTRRRLSSVDEKTPDSKMWKSFVGNKLPLLTVCETHSATRPSRSSNSEGRTSSPSEDKSYRRRTPDRNLGNSAEFTRYSWGIYTIVDEYFDEQPHQEAVVPLPPLVPPPVESFRRKSEDSSKPDVLSVDSQSRNWSCPSAWGLFANAKNTSTGSRASTQDRVVHPDAHEAVDLGVSDQLVLVSGSPRSMLFSTTVITCRLGQRTVELQQATMQSSSSPFGSPLTNKLSVKVLNPDNFSIVVPKPPGKKTLTPKTPTKSRENAWGGGRQEATFRPLVPLFATPGDAKWRSAPVSPPRESHSKGSLRSGAGGSRGPLPLQGFA